MPVTRLWGPVSLDRQVDRTAAAVRWFEPGDEAGFLSLHERVFGTAHSTAWFDWRYGSPFLDHVPVLVAERRGVIVGARTFLPFPIRGGEKRVLAIQPAAAMVHPDFRRQGIFTQLVDRTFEDYAEAAPEVVFNFPTAVAKAANLRMGWRAVGRVPVWYRIHRPASVLTTGESGKVDKVLDGASRWLSTAAARAGDRFPVGSDRVPVRRHDGVAVDVLTSLYEGSIPAAIHVVRDRPFYGWRYGNPEWACATYVASRDGVPVAAMLTVTAGEDRRQTALVDGLPLAAEARDPIAFASLLTAVCDAHADSAVLRAAGSIAPPRQLWRHGFVRNDLPIVSSLTSRRHMVARPIDPDASGAWQVGGFDLDDLDDWFIALGDMDAPV